MSTVSTIMEQIAMKNITNSMVTQGGQTIARNVGMSANCEKSTMIVYW